MKFAALFAVLMHAAGVAVSAADWPAFRGAGGNGFTAERDIALEWDETTGENIAWKAPLTLQGAGSPVVCRGKVFLTAADAETRKVLCFDAETGKRLWEKPCPASGTDHDIAVDSEMTYAAPTSVADGQRVVSTFANGDIVCFDLDGKELWDWKLDGLEEGSVPDTTSPATDGKLIYIWNAGCISVLDAGNGTIVYEKGMGVSGSYASPVVAGDKVILVGAEQAAVVQAGRNFKLLGQGRLAERVDASPAVSDGRIFLRGAMHLYCIQAGVTLPPDMRAAVADKEETPAAPLPTTAKPVRTPLETPPTSKLSGTASEQDTEWPVFRGGPGRTNITKEKIPRTDWPREGPPIAWQLYGGYSDASFAAVDGRIYTVGIFPAPADGEAPDQALGPEKRHARYVNGKNDVLCSDDLFCVDAATGKLLWRTPIVVQYHDPFGYARTQSTPAVDDGKVYATSRFGHIICCDARTGKKLWFRDPIKELGTWTYRDGAPSSPLVYDGKVILHYTSRGEWPEAWGPIYELTGKDSPAQESEDSDSEDGPPKAEHVVSNPSSPTETWVLAFDKLTGEDKWKYISPWAGSRTFWSSAVAGRLDGRETIVCHLGSGIVGLDPTEGKELWRLDFLKDFENSGNRLGHVYSTNWPLLVDDHRIVDRLSTDTKSRRTYCMEVRNGVTKVLWYNTALAPWFHGLVVTQGSVIGVDSGPVIPAAKPDLGLLQCYDVDTGRLLWSSPLCDAKKFTANNGPMLTLAGDKLVMVDTEDVSIVKVSRTGPVLLASWKHSESNQRYVFTTPLFYRGRLYVRLYGNGQIICYDMTAR